MDKKSSGFKFANYFQSRSTTHTRGKSMQNTAKPLQAHDGQNWFTTINAPSNLLANNASTTTQQPMKQQFDNFSTSTSTNTTSNYNNNHNRQKLKISQEWLDESKLSDEQQTVLKLIIQERSSVFFTGAAGTGKSFLLSRIVQALKQLGKADNTFITASTGIAACNIGGQTIHAFSGVGLGNGTIEELMKNIKKSRDAKTRWKKVEVLIVDEVSMLDGALFDKLELIARRMKLNDNPFGGIQVILCGDFFQLPPIGIGRNGTKFCFEANSWRNAIPVCFELQKIFRQKDPKFVTILNELRIGQPSVQTTRALEQIQAKSANYNHDNSQGLRPTRLYCRNENVEQINNRELRTLTGSTFTYDAIDIGEQNHRKQLEKNCQALSNLNFKIGAQVILLKNLDVNGGLANGSRGVIVDFQRDAEYQDWGPLPVVEFQNNQVGQQQTGKEKGEKEKKKESEKTTEEAEVISTIIKPQEWKTEIGTKLVAKRTQIPLKLAWALSIHKSQGMTIPNLMVSLFNTFEFGQAYVALSRATSLDTLFLEGFTPRTVKAHENVKRFYQQLQNSSNIEDHIRNGNNQNVQDRSGWIDTKKGTGNNNNGGKRSANEMSNNVSSNSGSAFHHYSNKRQTKEPNDNSNSNNMNRSNNNYGQSQSPAGINSAPKALSAEQKARIENNKRKAMEIRLKKQQSLSQKSPSTSKSN